MQQIKGGRSWKFHFNKYPNKTRQIKLIFTVGNNLGDSKGANMLSSRYENNNIVIHNSRDGIVIVEDSNDSRRKKNLQRKAT